MQYQKLSWFNIWLLLKMAFSATVIYPLAFVVFAALGSLVVLAFALLVVVIVISLAGISAYEFFHLEIIPPEKKHHINEDSQP